MNPDTIKKVAVVPGDRLGDSLLMSVISYNLVKNGYNVVTFSSILGALKEWLPSLTIAPLPKVNEAQHAFKDFSLIIHQHNNPLSREPLSPAPESVVLYGTPFFMQPKSLIDVYLDVCRDTLKLPNLFRSNGLEPPNNLTFRCYKRRIIIHPTSLRAEKNWPAHKFLKLAAKLKKLGYDPQFTVGPQELSQWSWLRTHYPLNEFPTLDHLAAFLYESGFMIGNDSGVAHLASNLGIPTTTLFIRKGVARRWHPNFYPGEVILPSIPLPGRPLKEKYWKYFISVNKVLHSFQRLAKQHP